MNTGINEVWADIDYLIARVEQKTMSREEVVAIVRKKLDAAPREPAPFKMRVDYDWSLRQLQKDAGVPEEIGAGVSPRPFGYAVEGIDGLFTSIKDATDQVEFLKIEYGRDSKVIPLYTTPPAPPVDAELQRDAERLDWLMLMVSGRELRRIGVDTSGNCTRQDIDSAIQARRQQG